MNQTSTIISVDRAVLQLALEALETGKRVRAYEGGTKCQISLEDNAIAALRAALAEPVQEPVAWMDREGDLYKMPEIEGWAPPHTMLYTAPPQRPAEPVQDPELSAALGWVAGISEPLLDRKALLRRVAEIATDSQAKTKRAWDVGYDCGIRAAKEFAAERRLTDEEIGQLWFESKLLGVTETQARRLIRAAEAKIKDNYE